MSFLGSFMTLSQRYFTRKATLDGAPESSLLGIAREYFFWLAKSSSSPPLEKVRHIHTIRCDKKYLNSTLIGSTSSLIVIVPVILLYVGHWYRAGCERCLDFSLSSIRRAKRGQRLRIP